MLPGPFENFVWYLNILATVVLIARLYFQGLAWIYRVLLVYLLMGALQSVLTLIFAADHKWTYLIYVMGQTVKMTLAIFMTMELFRLALVQQPALARFGRGAIGYFFAAAAALAALNPLIAGGKPRHRSYLVAGFHPFERTMDSTVMFVLILMSVFLVWFPVRTRRNVAICMAGFVVYSFQRWTGLLLGDLWPAYLRQFSTAMLCVSFGCLTGWIILLRREGEKITVETGHGWNPVEADRLRFQLDAINTRLGASGANNTALAD